MTVPTKGGAPRRVSDSRLDKMRHLSAAGVRNIVIAARLGVSRSYVSLVLRGLRRSA